MKKVLVAALLVSTIAQPVSAGVCDYRLSRFVNSTTSGAVAGAGAATAATGLGMKALGFYTLTHSITGLTMLGSTAAGASAAGTAGIIAGTAGTIGSAAAFVMAPVVIGVAGAGAAAVAGLEGACFLLDEERPPEAVEAAE